MVLNKGQQILLWIESTKVGFARLASMCHERGIHAFKFRPKYPLGLHLVDDLSFGLAGMNPCSFSCWSDEDYIGRCSRVSRSTHPLLQATRTIQKVLGLYHQQLQQVWKEEFVGTHANLTQSNKYLSSTFLLKRPLQDKEWSTEQKTAKRPANPNEQNKVIKWIPWKYILVCHRSDPCR